MVQPLRPRAKKAMKEYGKKENDVKIENLRVTRKKFKKERVVSKKGGELRGEAEVRENTSTLTSDQKRMRDLRKKLKAIEALLEREARGETLDEQQQLKVGRLSVLLTELEDLAAMTTSES